ncbi:glutamate ABC transporter substrate-binding protein [Actinomyces provencensis]|uniref:glutamate ABC transporter substrate-binding protein n=1 Tax=Actinomyces provencensis TaxID=1720198 RepID=UPI001177DFEF|nr:glutamate ABC transporter substrate-binding protein [Actinomyces provencensis]
MSTTRHHLAKRPLAALAMGAAAMLALSACGGGSESGESGESGAAAGGGFESSDSAYDAIVNGGPVADDSAIEASEWAKAVKESGTLRVGGTETSTLFSNLDPTTGVVTGFDAGLTQLLARYILGDASKTALTQVSVDTREELLVNGQVDIVAATYSITPERLERISFAGPYYSSQAGILVKADNTDINSVDDLAGKTVTTQAGSTGETTIAEFAPEATVLALPDNAQAVQSVEQGRADAYVIDQTLLLNNVVKAPDQLKVVGEPFGDADLYGLGVPKDSDAVAFINDFLQKIEDDGTWLNLWKQTIQAQTEIKTEPTPPTIGEGIN